MNASQLARIIEASEYFDRDWYLQRYPDAGSLELTPAEHYIRIGALLMRDPSPEFSTRFYLATCPDVAEAGVNPLWHYIAHGRNEGRAIAPSGYDLPQRGDMLPVPLSEAAPPQAVPARLIAFYLPQFHPIPENDAWWGEGFTEWTNVRPAKPQFIRHYQPHVPGELGYYDLRDIEVQRRQVALAKQYGLGGFCFYFYWFAGKRLLETPVRNYLDTPDLDLPFCLCWANENWSRRWDGRDQDVLMAQKHSPEDDLAFIAHVAEYMRDPRYIRVDGRPLLLVYRPNLLPEPAATVERWRRWCRDNGIGEIYLAYTQSFESNDPRDYGFDAAIEFPPNNSGVPLITKHRRTNADFQGRIFDWSTLVERSFAYPTRPYPLFRGICPSWDNTARRGINGTILENSNPSRFTRWATHAIRDANVRFDSPDERLVFVNAWNEWAEGAHLEPDQRYGYAWLESIRVALACNSGSDSVIDDTDAERIAIVIDARDPVGIEDIIRRTNALPARHKLFVATVQADEMAVRELLTASGRDFTLDILPAANVGRGAFLETLPQLISDKFRIVIHLRIGSEARDANAQILDPDFIEQSLARFAADTTLGMICPESARTVLPDDVRARLKLEQVGGRLGVDAEEVGGHVQWDGRAFMARTMALGPMACLSFGDAEFDPLRFEYDANLPGAIERALTLSPVAAGFRVTGSDDEREAEGRRIVIVSHDAHPHGAQLLALNMARTYREMGFEVDMLVLGTGKLLDRFREIATVHRIDLARDRLSATLRLLAAIRALGAEVAIANTTVSGLLVPMLKQAGFRVVSLIHELPGILESYGLQEHARAIAAHADRVVFPARIVRDGFHAFVGCELAQGVIRPQGLYLRNPYRSDADRNAMRQKIRARYGLVSESRIILCVGYADHRKGLDLFAETCIHVMRDDPHAVAMWVGHADQSMLAQAQDAFAQAGFKNRFVSTGLVDNPQDYYAAADVYALTSREDPFPSVVMEALDARVPVVSFAGVVGSEELLERGAGLLVPAFDVEAMATAIGRLLTDHASARQMAEKGRDIIESEFVFRHYLFDLLAFAGCELPKVSVVVPNYNYARYIHERLESIVNQTFPPFELIVLDDCSTDSSVEAIQDFITNCMLPTRLVVNEANSGSVFRQWRRGVEMARGDFVWIAEADDLADPEFLETALAAFADREVVLSYTQSRQMDSDGRILCDHYLDYVSDLGSERWTKPYVACGRDEIANALYLKNTIPNVSAVVFRRDVLAETLGRSQDEIMAYRNAGDWVVYLRVLENGHVSFNPRSLNSHRRHQSSVTVGSFDFRQLREILRVQRTVLKEQSLDSQAATFADNYVQRLYEQFGLSTKVHPTFHTHPEMQLKQSSSGIFFKESK